VPTHRRNHLVQRQVRLLIDQGEQKTPHAPPAVRCSHLAAWRRTGRSHESTSPRSPPCWHCATPRFPPAQSHAPSCALNRLSASFAPQSESMSIDSLIDPHQGNPDSIRAEHALAHDGELAAISQLQPAEACAILGSSLEGLSATEAAARQKKYGPKNSGSDAHLLLEFLERRDRVGGIH
jgi:hypothetical protein